MSEFAGWTGEEAVAEAPAGFGDVPSWLPASVQRAQALEDIAERREARAEERERADKAERARDTAVAAYVAAATARGEVVSASDIAAGNIGRSLTDVLAGASSEIADRVPVGQRAPRDYELLDLQPATRSKPMTPVGRAMANTLRRFTRDNPDADVLERARFASELRADLRRNGVR